MILNVDPNLHGPFWNGVEVVADHYDIIGGSICGSFIVFGLLAVILYRPWRRRIDRKRMAAVAYQVQDDELDDRDMACDQSNRSIPNEQQELALDAARVKPDGKNGATVKIHAIGESSRS